MSNPVYTLLIVLASVLASVLACNSTHSSAEQEKGFDWEHDLLLAQYDFKTDVDDLHSVAALATLLTNTDFSNIKYHTVAGTYGIQDGLYVPPNELMQLAFGNNWSDAHQDKTKALQRVKTIALETLKNNGAIWIADGGQSDFSADLVREIQQEKLAFKTTERIHIIQHSDWNEKVTSPAALAFVKANADYQKIPDGNALANGTPGFRSEQAVAMEKLITDQRIRSIWRLAINTANQYNGEEGRYLNEAIKSGGLDFSDFSEVCWILDVLQLENATHFFEFVSE